MRYSVLGGAIALAAIWSAPVLADDACKPLRMVGSVNLDVLDSHVYANVTVNGKPAKMQLSTAGGVTSFTPEGAAELGLNPISDSRVMLINSKSKSSESYVVVDDLSVGGAHIAHSQYMILPPSEPAGDVVGVMGTDLLSHFDVEFDFTNGKMNLFAQDHCPGKVIYWKHMAVSMVPLTLFQPTTNDSRTGYQGYLKRFEQMWVPVTLDGKSLPAQISTSGDSQMQSSTAQGAFGVNINSPGSEVTPDTLLDVDTFQHTFSALVFDGVTVSNPRFLVFTPPTAAFARQVRRTDTRLARLNDGSAPHITVGMNILKKLHLFASFGERRLYITEASAPAPTGPAPAAAATQ